MVERTRGSHVRPYADLFHSLSRVWSYTRPFYFARERRTFISPSMHGPFSLLFARRFYQPVRTVFIQAVSFKNLIVSIWNIYFPSWRKSIYPRTPFIEIGNFSYRAIKHEILAADSIPLTSTFLFSTVGCSSKKKKENRKQKNKSQAARADLFISFSFFFCARDRSPPRPANCKQSQRREH